MRVTWGGVGHHGGLQLSVGEVVGVHAQHLGAEGVEQVQRRLQDLRQRRLP
jgi:hypothetical protein